MLNGYQIIDADAHVFETPELWENYLEPEFKQFAISTDLHLQGEKIYRQLTHRVAATEGQRILQNHPNSVLRRFDAQSQSTALRSMGIDVAFQYPSHCIWILGIDTIDPQIAGAFTRAYNNWLRDFCAHDPDLLKGVGAINLHAPEQMVPELERIASFGWKAVCLLPNPVKGRLLSDPAYAPFWQACEDLNIGVGLHTAAHARVPTAGADRFQTRFGLHTCAHPLEQMMALLALIEGGVLDRHPTLKIGLLESGCGWLPYWLWRMDEEYQNLKWEIADRVKHPPSVYFQRQCFISIEPYEPYLASAIEFIGQDNIMFGSDYPHVDSHPDIVDRTIELEGQLSKDLVQKIVWDNPARFYGIS